jgi:hypothetical protein
MHNAAIYCGQRRGTYKQDGCLYRGFKADTPYITKVPDTVPKSYVEWSRDPGDGGGSGWIEEPVTGYPEGDRSGSRNCHRPPPALPYIMESINKFNWTGGLETA